MKWIGRKPIFEVFLILPMICYKCEKETKLGEKITRGDSCPNCHFDARVCKNCGFYDVAAYNECREISADRVVDKEKANFCDYFTPYLGGKRPEKKVDLKAQANALFKK